MFAGAPCWMTATRDGSSVVSCEKTGAGDLTLDDDPICGVGELLDDAPLVRGRRLEDGVEDDDHDRRAEAIDEVDDVGAVAAAEEPELVLDDHRVVILENARCVVERRAGAAHPLVHDGGRRHCLAELVDAAHDACAPGRRERARQRSCERREPAFRRRERADEADG